MTTPPSQWASPPPSPPAQQRAGPTNPVHSFIVDIGNKISSKIESKFNELNDAVINGLAWQILETLRPAIFRTIEDPYAPSQLKALLRNVYEHAWDQIQDVLLDDIMISFGRVDKLKSIANSEKRLEHWRRAPSLCKCCQPGVGCCGGIVHFVRALRARFLYADQPADGSAWKVLRDPLGLLIFTLKMHITTSVATFAVLFFLMDRRDEAQVRVGGVAASHLTHPLPPSLAPPSFLLLSPLSLTHLAPRHLARQPATPSTPSSSASSSSSRPSCSSLPASPRRRCSACTSMNASPTLKLASLTSV